MAKNKSVYIRTFGCVQNLADSERIKFYYWHKGYNLVNSWSKADIVVINTCVIRESAENRVYGLINKIDILNQSNKRKKIQIVITGCLVGAMIRQKSINTWKVKFPQVSEWTPIANYNYDQNPPLRELAKAAIIPISNGCNNFCSYCIVPYARGKEISRTQEEIISEITQAQKDGFNEIVLVGQNVNSYGADLEGNQELVHMGKKRLKSLFPKLLEKVANLSLTKISFVSSNPWDFSDELIEVIAKHENIDRLIHLPLQSGDDEVLRKMNRGYTSKEYLSLVKKITKKISRAEISTDIIVGFPGETEEAFNNTVRVCQKCDFVKAYINKYSPRAGTLSAKLFKDDVSQKEKRRRWLILEKLINKRVT